MVTYRYRLTYLNHRAKGRSDMCQQEKYVLTFGIGPASELSGVRLTAPSGAVGFDGVA